MNLLIIHILSLILRSVNTKLSNYGQKDTNPVSFGLFILGQVIYNFAVSNSILQ